MALPNADPRSDVPSASSPADMCTTIGMIGRLGPPRVCVTVGGRTRSLIGMSVNFRDRASRSGAHLGTWLTRHQLSSRDTPVDTAAPTNAPTQT